MRIFFALVLLIVGLPSPAMPLQRAVVGGLFQDYQDYGGVPYFHGGIDLRLAAGTAVASPVEGKVRINHYSILAQRTPRQFSYRRWAWREGDTKPSRYVEVAITDAAGRTWMFRHLDPTTLPFSLREAARSGTLIAVGQPLGTIVPWEAQVLPYREPYHHCHFEIIDAHGRFLNPLEFLPPRADRRPPEIHGIWAVHNLENRTFPQSQGLFQIDRPFDLILGITDRLDGSDYLVAPYRVSYTIEREVDGRFETIWPTQEIFRFDSLPCPADDRTRYAEDVYLESIITRTGEIKANGSGGPRFFLMNLTNGTRETGFDGRRALFPQQFAAGTYRAVVEAADFAGNAATGTVRFQIFRKELSIPGP
jgi:hypothetical protein